MNNTLYSIGSFQTGVTGFTAAKPKPGASPRQDSSSSSVALVDYLSSGSEAEQCLPTYGIYRRKLGNAPGYQREISISKSALKELALSGGGFPLSGNTAVAGTLCATLKNCGKSGNSPLLKERQKARDDMEKRGWKDAEGGMLEQFQDWRRADAPAKGFAETGEVLQGKNRSYPQPAGKGLPRLMKRIPEEESQKNYAKENIFIAINGLRKHEGELIETVLNGVPSGHLRELKAISITNNPIIIIRKDKPLLARAEYDSITAEIGVNRKLVDLAPRKKGVELESKTTLFHEIGHHFYAKNVPESLKKEFKDIALQEELTLFNKKYIDDVEYFAGAYAEWHVRKRALAKRHALVYDILKRIFEVLQ